MITDRDREKIQFVFDKLPIRTESTDSRNLEIEQYAIALITELVKDVKRESAEQARKDAAERAVAFVDNNMMGISDYDVGLLSCLRAAILSPSVTQGKTDAEKLTIAVKALEKINERHSFADIVDDSYIISRDALREIQ